MSKSHSGSHAYTIGKLSLYAHTQILCGACPVPQSAAEISSSKRSASTEVCRSCPGRMSSRPTPSSRCSMVFSLTSAVLSDRNETSSACRLLSQIHSPSRDSHHTSVLTLGSATHLTFPTTYTSAIIELDQSILSNSGYE